MLCFVMYYDAFKDVGMCLRLLFNFLYAFLHFHNPSSIGWIAINALFEYGIAFCLSGRFSFSPAGVVQGAFLF